MGRRWSWLILTSVALGACLSARSSQDAAPSRPSKVLRAEEIARISVSTAYDAVRLLRPQFLRWARGPRDSAHRLLVYVDGVRRGGVEELDGVPASVVREIRFLSAGEATKLYGTGHTLGALAILTGRPPR